MGKPRLASFTSWLTSSEPKGVLMETSFFPPPCLLHLDVDGVRKEAQAHPDGQCPRPGQSAPGGGGRSQRSGCGFRAAAGVRVDAEAEDLWPWQGSPFSLLVIPTFSRRGKVPNAIASPAWQQPRRQPRMMPAGSDHRYFFPRRLEHGHDIFRRHVGHDVVDLLEDKASARRQNSDPFADVFLHRFGRVKGSTVWVSQPPPQKTMSRPNSAFNSAGSIPRQEV